ncbi:TIGR03085 family metal-binding protein [Corynebacterium sp. TA-R-1]|uniref:TIGR03085 family metal-binding protein n=1 Tax=Corynebacterium stercoris TaxID=2943490 RepID=A0ABT1G3R8_9CORY|nr:TIGR03085 family metal-binding protein [Corynebacterium stercoris]MCP1388631.1 TIGR03085 family metal-binding protein [Corynebacterium stercoris]
MTFAKKERERLGELLLEVGPDAPTLNDGWTTHDLAVHLLIRERKPWATPGMFVSPLEPILEKETEKQKARPYEDVVREWMAGPPALIKPVDSAMNTAEHFIHHEDVRRGGGEIAPREFSQAVNKQLLQWAKRFGALAFRSSDVPVVLTPPTLPPITLGGKKGVTERGDNVIRVSGEPGELLIWVSGRDTAQVEISGNTAAAAKLERGV